jgi:hypothetical protein
MTHTAICIASGPSLTPADVEYCRGKGRVYVVKEGHLLAPWADVLYAADDDWWDKFKGVPEFAGERWTVSEDAAKKYKLHFIGGKSSIPWSDSPGVIATGGNSGFQIMNMAVLDGAERVILLGYDMGYAPGTDKHWWDKAHPRKSRSSNYEGWLKSMNKAAPLINVPVLNASVHSAITCFPRVNLRDVL